MCQMSKEITNINITEEPQPMPEHVTANKQKQLGILIAVLFFVLVIIVILTQDLERIEVFIRGSGVWGMLICLGIYGLLGASPVPSEPLTVLIGTMFGPLTATVLATLGNILAALMEYFVGERIRDVTNFDKRREKLPFGLGKLPVDSVIFLLTARMLPGYGPKFVSVICGIYRVPIWRYIWTTAISTTAGAVVVAYGGFGLLQLLHIR